MKGQYKPNFWLPGYFTDDKSPTQLQQPHQKPSEKKARLLWKVQLLANAPGSAPTGGSDPDSTTRTI